MNSVSNWWTTFFQGVAVDLWLRAVAPEQTGEEAAALAALLGLPSGAEVLDVPCGGGRLSLALAGHGLRLTGVDLSPQFLDHARATDEAGAVTWELRDMCDLPWRDRFDGAFCVGNSFGYLDDDANVAFVRAVAATLKPGGRFVLETPMVLENLLGHIHERAWWQVGDLRLLVANEYDPRRERLEIEYTFVSDGRVDTRRGSHRAYAYRELVELLEDAGFDVATAKPWTRAAHTVTFVATKK